MSIVEIVFLAIALSTDAFSAALAGGMSARNAGLSDAVKTAFFFGLFQFLMPLAGNGVSLFFVDKIGAYGNLAVFVILTFLGARMIYESVKGGEIPENVFSTASVILLAVATSIDALAAGVGLGASRAPVLFSAAVIGVTAFAFSYAGVIIGSHVKFLRLVNAGAVGGAMLILLAIKALVEFIVTAL